MASHLPERSVVLLSGHLVEWSVALMSGQLVEGSVVLEDVATHLFAVCQSGQLLPEWSV